MKQTVKMAIIALSFSFLLTSCYSYTSVVGKGAQGNTQVKKWNNYVIFGLIPVGVSDSKEMAAGATDYTIKVEHSFVNGLLSAITFGIYNPTTTTVTK